MKYKHVVFDVDGTLIDNEKVILLSLQKTIEQTDGRFLKLDDLRFVLGIPGYDALEKLDIPNPEKINALWEKNCQQISTQTQLFDGIEELLPKLNNYYSLGIITSKTKKDFIMEVERRFPSIISYFNFCVRADDTQLHKPNPEPMYFYMKHTNTKPNEILYIGDSVYDYKCAHGAGVDFGLAVWGSKTSERPATYHFSHPNDVLKLLIDN